MYRPRPVLILFLFYLFSICVAQFSFFDNMFRQQQHQEQHASGAAQWAAHRESIPCSQYLCKTLECVKNPAFCPCPDVEDIGCVVPDGDDPESGTVVCVRGKEGCDQVERLAWKGSSWQ
ncbi:hypothetical protein E1B28_004141 [Marasmius oreades]|uniref:Long chronological lifespan protein 2 n=1 Tax=Marasmius oreades TaxID=181124 RepID=A0A9P7UXZ9_9AGAR|nr:uncharacterized protein E1B28_004141 [Marasmius oreades]KAG7096728.1 hypothetical protein E1B28_004141 [Marasmius oreades]